VLNTAGMYAVGVYLLSLLIIGAIARRASRESSLKDYYLAGSSLGVVSLFFTLYATQYSGNALFAIPGQAYREGFSAFAIVLALMGIVLVYSSFAPKLHHWSKRAGFVTAGDFIAWRYDDRRLLIAANLIFVFTLTSYILANLKAMGLLVESATGGAVSAAEGILLLSLIMAIYESLGGMRSVVWTDVLQGSILLAGALVVFVLVWQSPELGLITMPKLILSAEQALGQWRGASEFVSLLLLVAIGAAVYPQAIQRIYAARSAAVLRQSYKLLVLMPLLVVLPLSLVAMSATQWLPPLSGTESERVILHAIDHVLQNVGIWSGLLVLYIGAAIAAIMSTVDSALLALGSIVTKDILGNRKVQISEAGLHRIGRLLTWVLMGVTAALAIILPQSIWALMVFKFELLVQVAPTIILGLRWPMLRAHCLLTGLIAGSVTAVLLTVIPGIEDPLGVHAGVWGLGVNLVCTGLIQCLWRSRVPH